MDWTYQDSQRQVSMRHSLYADARQSVREALTKDGEVEALRVARNFERNLGLDPHKLVDAAKADEMWAKQTFIGKVFVGTD